jgi:hypothetical protein
VLSKTHSRGTTLSEHSNDLVLGQFGLGNALIVGSHRDFAVLAQNLLEVVIVAEVDAAFLQIVQPIFVFSLIRVFTVLISVDMLQLIQTILELCYSCLPLAHRAYKLSLV